MDDHRSDTPRRRLQGAPFATASRARTLLEAFVNAFAASHQDAVAWQELAETLDALEEEADRARRGIADWRSKASHARVQQRGELAEEAERRAARAEKEFAGYLGEIIAIWEFLENGTQGFWSTPGGVVRETSLLRRDLDVVDAR
jgi:hypothetical protein